MMKKGILAIAALACLAWGCSSDSNDTPPAPKEIPAGTDVRPSWTAPNYDQYEQIMNVEVVLQDTLAKYASREDLLCATIGNEVRGVSAGKEIDGQWLFPLTIASNNAGVAVGLSYYCDKLHRIFTIIQWTTFNATVAPTGEGALYLPIFVNN